MKAGTRWLVVSFFLLASLFLLGISALADTTPEGYVYTVGTGGVTITGYTGTEVNLSVPGEIGGQPVIAIGSAALKNKSALTGIVLPDSVLTIGSNAFENCYALTDVSLGSASDRGQLRLFKVLRARDADPSGQHHRHWHQCV